MRPSVIFCAVLVLCSAAFGPIHGEASAPSADPTASFTLPFDLVDNRVFIEARLNGHGPFRLLLDTGAGAVTISADVAQQLGLHVTDAGEGQGVGEKIMRASQAQIAQVQIGAWALVDLDSHVMDLSDGPQVFGARPFDGVIGLPVFERMVVKHDYVNRVLTFTAPDRFA
jgi:Aspartyl protease